MTTIATTSTGKTAYPQGVRLCEPRGTSVASGFAAETVLL
jgi:hypothetical protein